MSIIVSVGHERWSPSISGSLDPVMCIIVDVKSSSSTPARQFEGPMLRQAILLLLVFAASVTAFAGETGLAAVRLNDVRLNQIQVIGTHNSYHIAPSRPMMEVIGKKSAELAQSLDATIQLVQRGAFLNMRSKGDDFRIPLGGLWIPDASCRTLAFGVAASSYRWIT